MWTAETTSAIARAQARRARLALCSGLAAGATGAAVLLGAIPPLPAGGIGALLLYAAWRLGGNPADHIPGAGLLPEDTRRCRLGWFSRLSVGKATVLIETPLRVRGTRLEDLVWAYSIRGAALGALPGLPTEALVLRFSDGREVRVRAFAGQVTPALSAIRHAAGHAALGWTPELAASWESDRAGFVAAVQANLGRVSGGGSP